MAKLELAQQRIDSVKKAEEYYNALRTNIQLSGNNLKVIAVSSVNPGEGKSTTSTNIAWAFARAGYKTLLIDADIRNWSVQVKRKNHWLDRLFGWNAGFIAWTLRDKC